MYKSQCSFYLSSFFIRDKRDFVSGGAAAGVAGI